MARCCSLRAAPSSGQLIAGRRLCTSPPRRCQTQIGEFLFTIHADPYASTVILSKLPFSSRWIFSGFALLALSSVITFYNLASQSYLSQSGFNNDAQLVLATISALLAAGGWWFLCQLGAKDSAQKSLLAKAYGLLGLQFSASCIGQLLRAGSVIPINRFSAPYWITALGFGVGAIGFFLTSYTLNKFDPMATDS